MSLAYKFFVPMVLMALFLLVACTEETEDGNQAKPVVPVTPASTAPVVVGDKIAQLEKEAKAGDPDAQYDLAYRYENGLGVPKDEAKALELYRQAADQGHSEAQNNLDAMSPTK